MLQQTTVATVRARYARFLERFPDLASLSRATEEQVLAAWSGLGYYARARHLRLAAREVMRRHGGRLPADPDTLRALPGFGEYMAAAIAALAHGVPAPAADANVTRVLSRVHAIRGIAGTRPHAAAVRRRMQALYAAGRPGDVLPRRPACDHCPLSDACAARRLGAVDRLPSKRSRPILRRRHVAAAWTIRRGAAMLVRGTDALLGGLWQCPAAEGSSPGEAAARLSREVEGLGLVLAAGPPIASTRHTMVHRRLEIRIYPAEPAPSGSDAPRAKSVRWFTPERLAGAAIPTLTRRIASAAGFLPGD